LLAGLAPEHGWGIERRLAWARTIEERSVAGEPAASLWAEAIASIGDRARSPHYGGLCIAPQVGLLPLGPDPVSLLWEFAELQTGEPPRRRADGTLVLEDRTGIVFVLIPGGTFQMGAQARDPAGQGFDPQTDEIEKVESPVLPVTLAPFFLSKYEMTQGQWLRATGDNPSKYTPYSLCFTFNTFGAPFTWLDPVEDVSWTTCTEVLRRLGLVLPTEAQWEYAARAGTSTPWWTGTEPLSLLGAANIGDVWVTRNSIPTWIPQPGFDDGYGCHAPVGSFRANPFGLHDVAGNVWEFCQDCFALYDRNRREGDGLKLTTRFRTRVTRGGGFFEQAVAGRSARREGQQPLDFNIHMGLRPARALE
jgi:formylglycine-generating enzyme required for sulfatase activity